AKKYKNRGFVVEGIPNFDYVFNSMVYRRLSEGLGMGNDYMFEKAFHGLRSISIKNIHTMAKLNEIEWGTAVNKEQPFKGSEIYRLAYEITSFVDCVWQGSTTDPILDFARKDLILSSATYLKNLKKLLYWANEIEGDKYSGGTLQLSSESYCC
ncbi:hypothetical protein THAOC_00035, partial [Thalassiosira oceanica]